MYFVFQQVHSKLHSRWTNRTEVFYKDLLISSKDNIKNFASIAALGRLMCLQWLELNLWHGWWISSVESSWNKKWRQSHYLQELQEVIRTEKFGFASRRKPICQADSNISKSIAWLTGCFKKPVSHPYLQVNMSFQSWNALVKFKDVHWTC